MENHDSERNGSTLSYKDGATNTIATEFMLAEGYGTPEVYASFAWTNRDDSPPADANGFVTDTNCNKGWVCQDRFTGVANMVGWHNYVGDAAIANWADDGDSRRSLAQLPRKFDDECRAHDFMDQAAHSLQ